MKNIISTISLTTLLTFSSSTLFADDDDYQTNDYYQDMARVIHAEPQYRTVRVSTPQRECWQERQQQTNYNQHHSYTSTIAGGIVGGVVGNQFGGGDGKKIMTVAGALLGGSVGRDYNYNNSPKHTNYNTVEQCRTIDRYHQEQQNDGYLVSYRYNGKTYTTHMDHRPGKRIPVEVSVRPVNNYY